MRSYSTIQKTTEIVVAYTSNNQLSSKEIPSLIQSVHHALCRLERPSSERLPVVEVKTVSQIAASRKYEWLISFIDGQPYKSLKRHLSAHGFTPDTYRIRYSLPADYPMVAPAYAACRSQIAKRIRLGHRVV